MLKAAIPRAFEAHHARQAEKARAAIERQLRKGRYWAITDDKAAAAIWRYQRAAMEGAARRNLDLLAEALVNGAVDPEFAPDEFKRQADRLEGLDRKEIVVLAAFLHASDLPAAANEAAWVTRHRATIERATRSGLFESEEDILSCMSSLSRTGWVSPAGGYGYFGHRVTPEFFHLARLVDFKAAARREFDGSDLS